VKPGHDSGEYEGLSLNDDSQPVVMVSWDDAKAYCDRYGLSLPTEAQWEYACRAGSIGKYGWGDGEQEAGRYANVADRTAKAKWTDWTIFDTDDGQAVSAPVGSYQPNAFGLQDMVGNVWEWCADWSDQNHYRQSPAADPAGPPSGLGRVVRGGSWFFDPGLRRAAVRGSGGPAFRFNRGGFRVAFTPGPSVGAGPTKPRGMYAPIR
jgi:formylglycine-generating enzyme required for sulfatase activity